MRLTVTHQGVPVGLVDLEVDDHQGIGTLERAPTLREVRLVELKTRPGVTVFVEFGHTMANTPAEQPPRPSVAPDTRPFA